MKQKLFGAAAVVALLLTATSCNDQKQSEFNFDSVTQEVTISAKITYDAGVEIDSMNPSGYKIANAKPAVGRKVFVEIPFAQYSGAAGVQGNKIFETVTDENGVFTITVPTKSTGVTGNVRLEEFTALHREYIKMENGKPVFKTKMYSYETPGGLNGINLKPGMYKFPSNNDIEYVPVPLETPEYDEEVTITGTVNLAYETGYREGAFKNATNANVEFEIEYNYADPVLANHKRYNFGTTTNAQGFYSITIPMESLADGFQINTIKVLGIGDNTFKHWVSDTIAEPEVVKGAYELAGIAGNDGPLAAPWVFANVINGITYDLGAKNLIFTPYYNAGITNIPAPENWSDDLIGWSAGRSDLGFNETYNKTVKLTGKVYMPYLTEYGVGAYKNERQTIKISSAWVDNTDPFNPVTPYTDLVIITDEDGSFSVDLPVSGDDDLSPFTVELEEKNQPFEFKGSKKNVMLYDGEYGSTPADIVNIEEEGTEWYELGDFYFKFTPDAGNTPDEWNADLIGWYRDPVYKKINPEKKIKGQFLFAVEKSYGKGEYEPKPFIVTIDVDDDDDPATPNRSIAVKPDANGFISFDLPLKDELDQPTISVDGLEFKYKEFVHYTEYGKNETRLIADKYTEYKKVYQKKDPQWNEKIGTRYYKYAVGTAAAKLPKSFHKQLEGWLIITDADDLQYSASATASGKAYKTVETGFLAGKFEPLAGEIIKTTIDLATDVEVLTDVDGNFSFKVPLKFVGEKPDVDVATGVADKITVDKFTHYDLKETMIISGKLTPESIEEDNSEWNDLGTVYYTFEPDNKANVWDGWDTYTKFIAGWQYKKGFTFTKSVTGAAMIAKETEFRKGEFVVAPKFPVLIEATNSGLSYAAATDAEGNWTINVLEEYDDDDDVINWTHVAADLKKLDIKFEHFRKAGSESIKKLEGGYTYKDNVNPSTNWNEKGTDYYQFSPDAVPATFTQALPGWVVWDKDAKTTLTIEGSIKKAAETWKSSTAQETWAAAGFATADVTITGIGGPYKVCTSGNGKFTFTVKVKEQVDSYTITVAPDDIDEDAFSHWTDQSANGSKIATSGTFRMVTALMDPTCNTKTITKTGSTTKYEFKPSAKMYFDPDDALLTGWGAYDWSGKYADED